MNKATKESVEAYFETLKAKLQPLVYLRGRMVEIGAIEADDESWRLFLQAGENPILMWDGNFIWVTYDEKKKKYLHFREGDFEGYFDKETLAQFFKVYISSFSEYPKQSDYRYFNIPKFENEKEEEDFYIKIDGILKHYNSNLPF